ncbi:MAG: T9SS type A sorting domain-containing protein [Melioribacteraceae bacterium]|nr:T9SS type A sorting domain-containing protein [Melioribacteraceae bacterium]
MKRLVIFFFLSAIFTTTTFSQLEWMVYKFPLLSDNRVSDVTFDSNGDTWISNYLAITRITADYRFIFYNDYNSGLPWGYIKGITIDSPGDKWISSLSGGLIRFSEQAEDSSQWTIFNQSNSGLPDDRLLCPIAIDNEGNKWIVNMGGLAKFSGSALGSEGWTIYNSENSPLPYNGINCIEIDADGLIWIGTGDGLATFDGISNWKVYKPSNPISIEGLPHNHIYTIAFDQNNTWIGTPSGLVKFDGTSMTTYNKDNSNIADNSVLALAIDFNGTLWIGGNFGLTKFDGSNWITFNTSNSGLPNNSINSITIDASGNKWISTGTGLAVFKEGGIVSVEEIEPSFTIDYSLNQNYPNPFNPTTKINFSIPISEFVTIKIYDILGREVTTLINEFRNAGNHQIDFNGNGLTSGVYFYKISSGNYSETKKMILLM